MYYFSYINTISSSCFRSELFDVSGAQNPFICQRYQLLRPVMETVVLGKWEQQSQGVGS